MSTNDKVKKASKITTISSAIVLAAFIACAGFTAFSVNNITAVVEDNIIANKNGVPTAWSNLEQLDSLESETSAIVSNGYVEYTTSLKNSDPHQIFNLTHISSFISEANNVGFVPLTEESLEYTYDPSAADSWIPVSISSPDSDETGFKLDSTIYLGGANSSTDTVYFRYNVSPSEEGSVSDKISFVTETDLGDANITTNTSSVEYNKAAFLTNSENAAAAENNTEPATESDSSYAKPLGAFSNTPSSSVISASTFGAINISKDTFNTSVIIIASALGAITIVMIIYIIIRKKKSHAKTKKSA